MRNIYKEDNESTNTNKSEQAFGLIILVLGEYQMVHVSSCTTSRDAWMGLRHIYAEPSTANRMRLYEKLLAIRLKY